MTTNDGSVRGTTKIVDRGPAVARWNLVLLAEGYREAELDQFAGHAESFAATLLATPPFDEMEAAINVYRVDVASTQSGADDPDTDDCSGSADAPDTYFDATFCTDGLERLLTVDTGTVIEVADEAVPEWHVAMVIVNSPKYGGSGVAGVPVFSLDSDADQIGLHELGHAAFALADEYPSRLGCDVPEPDREEYEGAEPVEPNVTAESDRDRIKWRDRIEPGTPVPTTENADCTECDSQPNPVAADTVGAFEGARYFRCGLYRPQFNCLMNELGEPFCAVCRERIRTVLAPHLRDLVATAVGKVELLRVHRELGFGPPDNHIPVHVVTRLDAAPDTFFGFPLRGGGERPVHGGWLDALRDAFRTGSRVRIEYGFTGKSNELVHNVELLTARSGGTGE